MKSKSKEEKGEHKFDFVFSPFMMMIFDGLESTRIDSLTHSPVKPQKSFY